MSHPILRTYIVIVTGRKIVQNIGSGRLATVL